MGGSKKMQQVRSIANRPQGGGNKKQGLPPSIGRAGWFSNFIRTSAGGYFRGIPPAGPADPCPTKEVIVNYDIDTQDKANALRGVTKIIGDLFLGGIDNDITDLSPFDCLKEVTGRIGFGDDSASEGLLVETISGFNNLAKVGGGVWFGSNPNLKTISGFRNLINVGKTDAGELGEVGVVVGDNPELIEISGFGNLKTVEGSIIVSTNDVLPKEQFSAAFNNLISIGGNIQVFGNDVANDFDAPGDLKWGVDANRTLNSLTIGGAQLGTNSFGGLNNPPQTTALFDLPYNS